MAYSAALLVLTLIVCILSVVEVVQKVELDQYKSLLAESNVAFDQVISENHSLKVEIMNLSASCKEAEGTKQAGS